MPLGDQYWDKLVGAVVGDDHSVLWPDVFWAEALIVAPTTAGGGTVADYPDYAGRVPLNNDSAQFTIADGQGTNLFRVEFPPSTGEGSDIVAFALYDDEIAGDLTFYVPLRNPIAVHNGTPVFIDAGSIVFFVPAMT